MIRVAAHRPLLAMAAALFCGACAHSAAGELNSTQFINTLHLASVGRAPYSVRALQGRVVLLNFFATWCFPCLAEIPVLEELQKKYGAQGFSVIAVGMDLEGAKVLEPFAAQYQLAFPVLVADERIHRGDTPIGPIKLLPTTLVFGRDGRVLAAYAGVADHEDLARLIERGLTD